MAQHEDQVVGLSSSDTWRQSASAQSVIPQGGGGSHGLFGDNVPTSAYGNGTQAQADTIWENATGLTLEVRRKYYPGLPPTSIPTDLQDDKRAGRQVALSFKPSTVLSSSDRTTINSFLLSCKNFGLVCSVTMYHEPVPEIGSSTTYGAVQAYYGPTVRQHYPLNFSGVCGSGGGSFANYQTYYDAAINAGAVFDTASVDYYCSAFVSGVRPDGPSPGGHVALADQHGLPFGMLEWGVSEDTQNQTQGTSYYNYLIPFWAGRITAGKSNTYITHFSHAVSDGIGGWPPLTASDYQCSGSPSLIQRLAAAV